MQQQKKKGKLLIQTIFVKHSFSSKAVNFINCNNKYHTCRSNDLWPGLPGQYVEFYWLNERGQGPQPHCGVSGWWSQQKRSFGMTRQTWINIQWKNSFYHVILKRERERNALFNDALNTFYLRYMASDIWLRTILIVRKETRCRHIGYSYRLTARVLLYAPSHRQDNTYHSLCYTSRGALAGTINSSMG